MEAHMDCWDDDERNTSLISPFNTHTNKQTGSESEDDVEDFIHILRSILKEINKVQGDTSDTASNLDKNSDYFLDPFYCKHTSRSSSLSSEYQDPDLESTTTELYPDKHHEDGEDIPEYNVVALDQSTRKYMYS